MPHALIVEPDSVIREPLETAFQSWGFTTAGAENCGEAWEAIGAQLPELIVIEPDLGEENGLRLIERLMREHGTQAVAVVILTACTDRERVIEAARLGIRQYLLKTGFDLDGFRHRIDLALRRTGSPGLEKQQADPGRDARASAEGDSGGKAEAPGASGAQPEKLSDLEPVMTKEKSRETIEHFGQCRALSPTFSYAMKLLNDSQASVEQIAAGLKRDQALAMRVLKAANGGGYNRGRPVHTVEQAAVRLGVSELRQVVTGVAVMDEFGGGEFEGFIDVMDFWEHCLATAMICQEMARQTRTLDPEEAFLIGLLHDIGRVVMVEQFGPKYVESLSLSRKLGQPLNVIEKRMLNIDHAEVAGMLFREWRLPESILGPIAAHHLSLSNLKHVHPALVKQASTLIGADRLASALLLGGSGEGWLLDFDEMTAGIGLSHQALGRIIERVPGAVEEQRWGLAAASGVSCERRMCSEMREMLCAPIRALHLTTASGPGALSVLLDRMGGGAADTPNLVSIRLRQEGDDRALLERLEQAEKEAGGPLPALIQHPPKMPPSRAMLEGRPVRAVTLPMAMRDAVTLVSGLLEEAGLAVGEAPGRAA